jgi:hypothetical protein
MMKIKFLKNKLKYDGTQLRPLWNYLEHDLIGSSVVAFVGPCAVGFAHMVDGEDLKEKAQICGDEMLHFVFEIFDQTLFSAVLAQRLFACQVQQLIFEKTKMHLRRSGDDLYLDNQEGSQKLSISIATKSTNSTLIHFAMNLTNAGTPVRTCSLVDLGLELANIEALALELLLRVSEELESIQLATWKVRTL